MPAKDLMVLCSWTTLSAWSHMVAMVTLLGSHRHWAIRIPGTLQWLTNNSNSKGVLLFRHDDSRETGNHWDDLLHCFGKHRAALAGTTVLGCQHRMVPAGNHSKSHSLIFYTRHMQLQQGSAGHLHGTDHRCSASSSATAAFVTQQQFQPFPSPLGTTTLRGQLEGKHLAVAGPDASIACVLTYPEATNCRGKAPQMVNNFEVRTDVSTWRSRNTLYSVLKGLHTRDWKHEMQQAWCVSWLIPVTKQRLTWL